MRSSLTPGSGAAAGVSPAGNLSLGYLELSRIGVVFRQGYSRLAGVGRPEQGPLGGEQESLTGLISARSAWLELDFGRFPSISSLSGPTPPCPPAAAYPPSSSVAALRTQQSGTSSGCQIRFSLFPMRRGFGMTKCAGSWCHRSVATNEWEEFASHSCLRFR